MNLYYLYLNILYLYFEKINQEPLIINWIRNNKKSNLSGKSLKNPRDSVLNLVIEVKLKIIKL